MTRPTLPPLPKPRPSPRELDAVHYRHEGGRPLELMPAAKGQPVSATLLQLGRQGVGLMRVVASATVVGAERLLRALKRVAESLLWTLGYARVDIVEPTGESERREARGGDVKVVRAVSGSTRRMRADGVPRSARGTEPSPADDGHWMQVGSPRYGGAPPLPEPLPPAADPRLQTASDVDDSDTEVSGRAFSDGLPDKTNGRRKKKKDELSKAKRAKGSQKGRVLSDFAKTALIPRPASRENEVKTAVIPLPPGHRHQIRTSLMERPPSFDDDDAGTTPVARAYEDGEDTRVTPANVLSLSRYKSRRGG